MFSDIRGLFQILDNDGPIARTAPAPYPIIDCEKMSAKGLTCNAVIQSSMEPPGNNQCGTWSGVEFQAPCVPRPLDTVAVSSMEPPGNNQCGTWSGVEFQAP